MSIAVSIYQCVGCHGLELIAIVYGFTVTDKVHNGTESNCPLPVLILIYIYIYTFFFGGGGGGGRV